MTEGAPNPLIADLFSELDSQNIRYCHFKSNDMLDLALAGVGDLDLLLHSDDMGRFQEILAARRFYLAIETL